MNKVFISTFFIGILFSIMSSVYFYNPKGVLLYPLVESQNPNLVSSSLFGFFLGILTVISLTLSALIFEVIACSIFKKTWAVVIKKTAILLFSFGGLLLIAISTQHLWP